MHKQHNLFALSLLFVFVMSVSYAQKSENETYTYQDLMKVYKTLDKTYENTKLEVIGETDSGYPLHVFVVEPKTEQYVTVFINNGIHPGEACGIDASVNLLKEALKKGGFQHVKMVVVPVYNVGGYLTQSCCTRANQNGPVNQGFRGNAQNLDLNRDFIKQDSKNAQSFAKAYGMFKPHFFVDTHTSNGADYQYTMTLIPTHHVKLPPSTAGLLQSELSPYLFKKMEKKGWPMSPYVNVFGNHTPNEGFSGFFDHPRYSTGYTALKGSIGFTTEAHMLKPYEDRVASTQTFLELLVSYADTEYELVLESFKQAEKEIANSTTEVLEWQLDPNNFETLEFEGYAFEFIASKVHDSLRLKYRREEPETFEVNYYNAFLPVLEVDIPEAYVIPAGWHKVAEKLATNGVEVTQFSNDTTLWLTHYKIEGYDTYPSPYEGHYGHFNTAIASKQDSMIVGSRDFVVFTNQANKKLIVQTLEPQGKDSYFSWNAFDAILQQKEGYSAYVFEDTAAELLRSNSRFYEQVEQWKMANPKATSSEVLRYVYKNSPYAEKNLMRYPIMRLE